MKVMKQKEEILNIIKLMKTEYSDKFGVQDIALFGSFAKENENSNSDVDIMVSLKEGFTTFDNFMDIKISLEELLNRRVDLVIKDSIRNEFRKRIFDEAIYA